MGCGSCGTNQSCNSKNVCVASTPNGRESWVWPFMDDAWSDQVAKIDANAAAFTGLMPGWYSLDYQTGYSYVSGPPLEISCVNKSGAINATSCYEACSAYSSTACNGSNNNDYFMGTFSGMTVGTSYNGKAMTRASFTAWAHSRGLKVVPILYAGASNAGTDTSVEAILCNGGTTGCATQTNFINGLISEMTTYGYDGWNLDFELGTMNGAGTGGACLENNYQAAFISLVAALKAAYVANSLTAIVSVDVIVSNIVGTYCSGNCGYLDFASLATSAIDEIIIEDYGNNWQTTGTPVISGWTYPTACGSPLESFYGAATLNTSSPVGCDDSVEGLFILMCNLPASKVVIGYSPSLNATNPIEAQFMAGLASYGYTKIAAWPTYDNALCSGAGEFMSDELAYSPSCQLMSQSWYTVLENFLAP